MAFQPNTFKSSFWETDFSSQTGFETIIMHIKEGQKSCKWLEDYLKQRAKAEDEYGKALQKLAKVPIVDFGSLRKSLEKLRSESDVEAILHISTAAKIQEEASKLEKFRERQKEERKGIEDTVHKSHKIMADLYRRVQTCKVAYESRCKAVEKADAEIEKFKLAQKQKELDRARKNSVQTIFNCIKADDEYKLTANTVESSRQQWEKDHITCCDQLQKMEEERIILMRNMIWCATNVVSDLCCQLDDSREEVRLITEHCDESADIRAFIAQKGTSTNPLPAIEYVQSLFPNDLTSLGTVVFGTATSKAINGSSQFYDNDEGTSKVYIALYQYVPAKPDEIHLEAGDIIKAISPVEQGWLKGLNVRTNETGFLPFNYVEAKQ